MFQPTSNIWDKKLFIYTYKINKEREREEKEKNNIFYFL
jgi:hypothetical protein